MKSKTLRISVCAVASFLLLWICNALWDSNYTFGAGDNDIVNAALLKKISTRSTKPINEIFPVNISYDRELVPISDAYGIPIGEVDIADRKKLTDILIRLNEYRNYRYIICDIAFNEEYQSKSDSTLFSLLTQMPNIIIPRDVDSLPQELFGISANSGYKVFHHGEPFLKYRYQSDGEPSIPLRMWRELSGHDIIRHWWGYSTEKGRLCNNASVIDLNNIIGYANEAATVKSGNLDIEEKLIYHLGADLLDAGCPRELFEDKIVLIGDFFERDMHDTAIGQVPGIMLLYAAYRALNEGKNQVPYVYYFILYLIFLSYFLLIFFAGGWRIKDKLLAYILDSVSFTLPLEALNFASFIFGGFSINAVLIGSLFGLISYLKKLPLRHEE